LCFIAAFNTALVPLTAGTVISFSSFGSFDGNGEAT